MPLGKYTKSVFGKVFLERWKALINWFGQKLRYVRFNILLTSTIEVSKHRCIETSMFSMKHR